MDSHLRKTYIPAPPQPRQVARAAVPSQIPPNMHCNFADFLPVIRPHVDQDKAMKIKMIYSKLMSNEIQKPEFFRVLRMILGDGLIRNALHTLQLQQKLVQEHSSIRQAPRKQGEGVMAQTSSPTMAFIGNQNCNKSTNPTMGGASARVTASSVPVTKPSDQWNFLVSTPNPAPSFVGPKKKRLDAPPPSLPNKKQKADTIEQLPKKGSQKKQAMEVKKHQNVTKAGEKTSNKQEPREIKATTANLEAMLKWQKMAEEAQQKRKGSMVSNQTCPTSTDLPTMAESSECVEPQVQPTTGTQSEIEETDESDDYAMFLENVLEEDVLEPVEPSSSASQPDNIPEPICPPQQPEEANDDLDTDPIFQHLYDPKEDHLPWNSEDLYYLDNESFKRELAVCSNLCG